MVLRRAVTCFLGLGQHVRTLLVLGSRPVSRLAQKSWDCQYRKTREIASSGGFETTGVFCHCHCCGWDHGTFFVFAPATTIANKDGGRDKENLSLWWLALFLSKSLFTPLVEKVESLYLLS